MVNPFLEALALRPLLFDGAMGSLLYDRGIFLNRSYDALNLSNPELIRSIHRDYLQAGADVIECNTFGANRIALARHGYSEKVIEINRRGVELAREVAEDRALVAGAVGPSSIRYSVATESERKLANDALAEQMTVLAEAGVDLLVLETFFSIHELEAAITLRNRIAPELPVVAMMVFDAQGRAEGGLLPADITDRLRDARAEVVGANCGMGPPELYEVASQMVGRNVPIAIMPNAGLPSRIEGRTLYIANPEHFGVFARRMLKTGVRVIGGCCGTTPEHTRSMLGSVRMMSAATATAVIQAPTSAPPDPSHKKPVLALADRSRLGERLARGQFAVSVELTSPAGVSTDPLFAKIARLRASGIDIVNIADGPRATARISNLAICARATHHGVEPILHVCCRDRNYLALVAHLLGAHALGLRNLVVITGDPPRMGDYPFATPVYDVDSVGLLKIAAGLNAGIDPAGREIDGHTSFLLATGAEPAASDYHRELRRLELKRDAGAELIMTQPVYDPRTLEVFLDDVSPLGLPVMVGLLPLASHHNAEFLHNEVPGMTIPSAFRERMAKVGSGAKARAEGIAIASEALLAVYERVAGAYIMPPFNRVESALAILDVIQDKKWSPALPASSD